MPCKCSCVHDITSCCSRHAVLLVAPYSGFHSDSHLDKCGSTEPVGAPVIYSVRLCAGALRSIIDILQTMGGATLAVTTVVLGASMFPQNESQQTAAEQATSGGP